MGNLCFLEKSVLYAGLVISLDLMNFNFPGKSEIEIDYLYQYAFIIPGL